jgi:UDP-N-acetylglucosamine:LPS N-acetylglucosamine transferase
MGRLSVPVCSSISDPAGLHYWAHPGIDAHLLQWPEAVAEVDRIAGRGRAFPVKPLVDPRFLTPTSQAQARASLELPKTGPVAVVSGGGWGIGDVCGAAEEALTQIGPDGRALCLAGRNKRLLDELRGRFADEPRVRVLGFTDQMPEILSAADVLVHTTGGTTALEARVIGCPLINYGRGVAHVRAHARALQAQGVAEWAPRRRDLGGALGRALTAGRNQRMDVASLPDAADVILDTRHDPARPGR